MQPESFELMASASTNPANNFQQIADAVLRFTPHQQALLAGRIQKNLSTLVDATSKRVQSRVRQAATELTEQDIAREVEAVRAARHARRK